MGFNSGFKGLTGFGTANLPVRIRTGWLSNKKHYVCTVSMQSWSFE